MRERAVNALVGLAVRLVGLANWLERDDETTNWNPWVVQKKTLA